MGSPVHDVDYLRVMGRAGNSPANSRPVHEGGRQRALGFLKSRRADERGAALVEFAIVVPLLVLLLCGTLDFGMIFGGYLGMESGVASATRAISLNEYQYTGSGTCAGGPTIATADAVCKVVNSLGSLTGLKSSTVAVGICFVTPGATPSCGSASATGLSDVNDVEVCAQAAMQSTTGLTSIFVSGTTVSTSSRLLMEEPQPSNNATAFQSYNAADSLTSPVTLNGTTIPGMTCS